jgi:hypothetical protein
MLFSAAIVYTFNNNTDKIQYDEAKQQLKSYLMYNKYKSLNNQNVNKITIDAQQNIINSPIDNEITWLIDFKDDIKIIDCSFTNIVFQPDGTSDEAYIDIISNDGIYSNRINITSLGTVNITELVVTNDFTPDEIE